MTPCVRGSLVFFSDGSEFERNFELFSTSSLQPIDHLLYSTVRLAHQSNKNWVQKIQWSSATH